MLWVALCARLWLTSHKPAGILALAAHPLLQHAHASVESPYLGMAPPEGAYDLGHTAEDNTCDLGNPTETSATHDSAHTTDGTATYDTAGAATYDLGQTSAYDLGNGNDSEDDETDI